MGSAQIALGGDYSLAYSNPAGWECLTDQRSPFHGMNSNQFNTAYLAPLTKATRNSIFPVSSLIINSPKIILALSVEHLIDHDPNQ